MPNSINPPGSEIGIELPPETTPYWVEGAGNRFLLVEGIVHWLVVPTEAAQWAQKLCSATTGIQDPDGQPLDGLILLCRPQGKGDARMVIFNADGSRPEACGNALRCVTQVFFEFLSFAGTVLRIETDAGLRRGWFKGPEGVRVSMGKPVLLQESMSIDCNGRTVVGTAISMGNPHFVVEANGVQDEDVKELGAALSAHVSFPAGTNVEFVFVTPSAEPIPDSPSERLTEDAADPDTEDRADFDSEVPAEPSEQSEPADQTEEEVRVRVVERGVGETQACGSGACAVAYVLRGSQLSKRPLWVSLPGGILRVSQDGDELLLQGPATVRTLS